MNFRNLVIAVCFMLLSTDAVCKEQDALSVPLVRLMASPDKYNGQKVKVHGYVLIEVESYSIFLTRDDCLLFNTSGGLWLDSKFTFAKDSPSPQCKLYEVLGKYTSEPLKTAGVVFFPAGGFDQILGLTDVETPKLMMREKIKRLREQKK